jgi:hypothetical protein
MVNIFHSKALDKDVYSDQRLGRFTPYLLFNYTCGWLDYKLSLKLVLQPTSGIKLRLSVGWSLLS